LLRGAAAINQARFLATQGQLLADAVRLAMGPAARGTRSPRTAQSTTHAATS